MGGEKELVALPRIRLVRKNGGRLLVKFEIVVRDVLYVVSQGQQRQDRRFRLKRVDPFPWSASRPIEGKAIRLPEAARR